MEFTKKTTLPASPEEIYNAWLSSEGHTNMTGGKAEQSQVTGASFNAWDGYITGKNLILEPHNRIVQSWRTTNFKDGEPDSQIEVLLKPVEGGTKFILHHTNVPESGEHYIKGWEEHYLEPMKEYFSK